MNLFLVSIVCNYLLFHAVINNRHYENFYVYLKKYEFVEKFIQFFFKILEMKLLFLCHCSKERYTSSKKCKIG